MRHSFLCIALLSAFAASSPVPALPLSPSPGLPDSFGKVTRVFVYDHKNDTLYEWVGATNDAEDLYAALRGPNGPGTALRKINGRVTFSRGDRVSVWTADANKSLVKLTVEGDAKEPEASSDIAVLQKLTNALSAGTFSLPPLIPSGGTAAALDESLTKSIAGIVEIHSSASGNAPQAVDELKSRAKLFAGLAQSAGITDRDQLLLVVADLLRLDTQIKAYGSKAGSLVKLAESEKVRAAGLVESLHLPGQVDPPKLKNEIEEVDTARKAIEETLQEPEMKLLAARLPSVSDLFVEGLKARFDRARSVSDALEATEAILESYGHPDRKFATDYVVKHDSFTPTGAVYVLDFKIEKIDDKAKIQMQEGAVTLELDDAKPLLTTSFMPFGLSGHTRNTFAYGSDGVGRRTSHATDVVPTAAVEFTFFPQFKERNRLNYGVAFGIGHPWEGLDKASLDDSIPFIGLAVHRGDFMGVLGIGDERPLRLEGRPTGGVAGDIVPTFRGHRPTFFLGFGFRYNLFGL
jgi:hypothetical protein